MSNRAKRFEELLRSKSVPSGQAIRAAAKKNPPGYDAWVKDMIAGTPYTAEGFDLARAKLEAAGVTRGDAMRACSRWHAGHGLWVAKQNDDRRSSHERNQDRGTPAAAPAAAPVAARAAPRGTAHRARGGAYSAAVARYQTEGLTRGQAMSRAKRDDPEAFFAWLENRDAANSAVDPTHDASAHAGSNVGPDGNLSAVGLARAQNFWEQPGVAAVWGEDFNLFLDARSGRISYEAAKLLVRERSGS